MRFHFAQQIQPANGTIVADCENGIAGDFRKWSIGDREQFPQALRQLADDETLVVDREDGSVYRVNLDEAIEAGVGGHTIEVEDGCYVRAEVL